MREYYKNPVSFRNYQQIVSDKIDYQESINESCMVTQPTGTGKSIILIDRAIKQVCKGKTVAIIVPKIELVFNVEKYIKKAAPKIYKFLYTPVCSKLKYNPGKRLYVATYGSFMQRYKKNGT